MDQQCPQCGCFRSAKYDRIDVIEDGNPYYSPLVGVIICKRCGYEDTYGVEPGGDENE